MKKLSLVFPFSLALFIAAQLIGNESPVLLMQEPSTPEIVITSPSLEKDPQEEAPQEQQPERCLMDRAVTFAQKVSIQEERAKEAEEARTKIASKKGPKSPEKLQSQDLSRKIYTGPLPGLAIQHQISNIGYKGSSIEIENGCGFLICGSDQYIADKWSSGVPIEITLNHSWFSNHEYRIYNVHTGEYVRANLNAGPFKNHEFTFYIAQIDEANRLVWISNYQGSYVACYQISGSNSNWKSFKDWRVGDAIVEGKNGKSSWFAWGYDDLLINVNANNNVAARRVR